MAIKKKEEVIKPKLKDYQIIIAPFITEKSANVGGKDYSGVVLKVDRRASKLDVKEAVEKIFKVEVANVRTCNYIGKLKRSGRSSGRRAAYKKAYVNLKPGFEMNIFEGL